MTQTKNGKAKPAAAASAAATAPFEAFNFSMPTMDVPASFRDFAEKSVASAREAYTKLKTAAEETSEMVEDTIETAREGAFTMGVKAIDAVRSNSDASFALARDLFGARTFAEVVEIQTAYTRKAFDTVAAQVKEFQELAQKVVSDTAKPVTTRVEKTFKEIQAA